MYDKTINFYLKDNNNVIQIPIDIERWKSFGVIKNIEINKFTSEHIL